MPASTPPPEVPRRLSPLSRRAVVPLLAGLAALASCGGMAPPTLDSGRPPDEPRGPAPVPATVTAAAPPAPPPAPAPVPRAPLAIADCPLRWVPKGLQASVIILPADHVSRFMVPAFEALCACSRPGDHLAITLRVLTGTGELSLVTSPRSEPELPANPSVDACLSGVLAGKRFERFDVPSDVVCDDAPAAPAAGRPPAAAEPSVGPVSFFRPPRRVGCGESAGATIVYPLLVDRRSETAPAP